MYFRSYSQRCLPLLAFILVSVSAIAEVSTKCSISVPFAPYFESRAGEAPREVRLKIVPIAINSLCFPFFFIIC